MKASEQFKIDCEAAREREDISAVKVLVVYVTLIALAIGGLVYTSKQAF